MEPRRIIAGSVVLALAILALTSSSAFGCIFEHEETCIGAPQDPPVGPPNGITQSNVGSMSGYWSNVLSALPASYWNQVRSAPVVTYATIPIQNRPRIVVRKVAPPPAPLPVPVANVVPRGDSPNAARTPNGMQEYIAPQSVVWYKMADGGVRLNVWLDNGGAQGLDIAIFGPDQKDLYSKPVGRAARSTEPKHDLFWTGRSRFKGTWYARLTNHNDNAVPYSLNYERARDKAGDACRVCHGNIVDEWDRCEHSGSFCSDLKDEFQNKK